MISLREEVEYLELSTHVLPMTFKIKGYSKYKVKEEWTTEFLTHKGGYRMKLSVYPRGNSEETNGYVALFFIAESGPNDNEEVAWPLIASVTVQLLNQCSNAQHYSRTSTGRWDDSGQATSYSQGIRKFISCDELEKCSSNCQYLLNDCIYFCINGFEIKSANKRKSWLICN